MINGKNYPGSVILNSTSNLTGSLNKNYTNITDYFELKKTNQLLVEENEYLKNLRHLNIIADSLSFYPDTTYQYIGAKVISNSTHKPNNYLMLDKGEKLGIKIDMAVVSSHGIVGSVIAVSENYCSVMSILHKDSKISARIKKNDQLANILWDKMDYLRGTLTDIPSHLQLMYGDTIITSGHSLIFPEGILIGTVESYNSRIGSNLNSATIKFSTDYNKLRHVYLINNIRKEEQLKLKEVENE
jgi:rod shape-determining protein MreC